jgi:hypothetical protein
MTIRHHPKKRQSIIPVRKIRHHRLNDCSSSPYYQRQSVILTRKIRHHFDDDVVIIIVRMIS